MSLVAALILINAGIINSSSIRNNSIDDKLDDHVSTNNQDDPTTIELLLIALDLCVSSWRRGHANILCIVRVLTDDPHRESGREKHVCSACQHRSIWNNRALEVGSWPLT